jgi:hypothetical protein
MPVFSEFVGFKHLKRSVKGGRNERWFRHFNILSILHIDFQVNLLPTPIPLL